MKSIWSAKWYLLLGLFSYLLFVTLLTPLDFVWKQAKPHIGRLPVQVQSLSGTLWQGQAKVHNHQTGQLTADWQLHPAALLKGSVSMDFDVRGTGLNAQGQVQASPLQVTWQEVEGHVSTQYIEPMLRQSRVSIAGEFELNAFNGSFDLQQKQLTEAKGRLLYTGGDVGFPIDGKPINATLPMLVGDISTTDQKVELTLNDEEGQSIGNGYVQPDGWAGIAIKRRFIDILGQPWPAEATEDTVIFEVSQKLL